MNATIFMTVLTQGNGEIYTPYAEVGVLYKMTSTAMFGVIVLF